MPFSRRMRNCSEWWQGKFSLEISDEMKNRLQHTLIQHGAPLIVVALVWEGHLL